MMEQPRERWDGSRGTEAEDTDVGADAVRAGDTVVFRSKLNKEYEFVVADVDAEWITFETGQMVHKVRFDREDFAVRRTADEESGRVRMDEPNGEGVEPAADDPGTEEESEAADDERKLQVPNAD